METRLNARCYTGPPLPVGRVDGNVHPRKSRRLFGFRSDGKAAMITNKQNALLTESGPATAMGALFRRYWIPALLAEELPRPNCPPVRVQLLSERLIAIRDSA